MAFPLRIHFDDSAGFATPKLWAWYDGSTIVHDLAPAGSDAFGPFSDLDAVRNFVRFYGFTEGDGGIAPGNRGAFAGITERIRAGYFRRLGATALSLMPLAEFPSTRSGSTLGYNPSLFMTVERDFGSPDDLRELVDAAHVDGLAVSHYPIRADQVSPTWSRLSQPHYPPAGASESGNSSPYDTDTIGTPDAHPNAVPHRYRLIIVHRDRIGVFRTLLASAHRWPAGTAIMLDRRYAERRRRTQQTLVERRQRARRGEPEAQWYTEGFIIVEVATLPSQAAILRPFLPEPVAGGRA